MNFENFMKQLDRTIDLSKVFVEYSCMNETAFWLLNAQIEDLEREYNAIYKALETAHIN